MDSNIHNQTFSLTFSCRIENHKGMQLIGQLEESGFSIKEIREIEKRFQKHKAVTEYIDLSLALEEHEFDPDDIASGILIIRNGVNILLGNEYSSDDLYQEHEELNKDEKAFMYGRVVNKKARHNLCFADFSQTPDYESGKGTVVNFNTLPITSLLREKLGYMLGSKGKNLLAEGNYYYDPSKCGIGFHGDTERKIVVCARLGKSFPLDYQWFYKGEPIGERVKLMLNHSDLYVMSEKAVGTDWKKRNIPTLRHAAGADKFLIIKEKPTKKVEKNDIEKPKVVKKKVEKPTLVKKKEVEKPKSK